MPDHRVAHAPKPLAGNRDHRLEHRDDAIAKRKVSPADDGLANARWSEQSRCAKRGGSIGEIDLAHVRHFTRTLLAQHRAALHEDGGDDGVAASNVIDVVMGHVAMIRTIPQMVVRIDDGQRGFDGVFASQGKPVGTNICVGLSGRGHRVELSLVGHRGRPRSRQRASGGASRGNVAKRCTPAGRASSVRRGWPLTAVAKDALGRRAGESACIQARSCLAGSCLNAPPLLERGFRPFAYARRWPRRIRWPRTRHQEQCHGQCGELV